MSEPIASWTPVERARRFWTAHGRTADHLIVLHAFAFNPTVAWSPDGLCDWYGVRVDRARAIVAELAASRIVRAAEGGRGHEWNPAHDFALPADGLALTLVRERWVGAVLNGDDE